MQQYSLMIMIDHSLIVGLWGVVNNAGVNVVGDMETTPIDQINRCLSINLFGMIRVTQQVLPMIRKSQGKTERERDSVTVTDKKKLKN